MKIDWTSAHEKKIGISAKVSNFFSMAGQINTVIESKIPWV